MIVIIDINDIYLRYGTVDVNVDVDVDADVDVDVDVDVHVDDVDIDVAGSHIVLYLIGVSYRIVSHRIGIYPNYSDKVVCCVSYYDRHSMTFYS